MAPPAGWWRISGGRSRQQGELWAELDVGGRKPDGEEEKGGQCSPALEMKPARRTAGIGMGRDVGRRGGRRHRMKASGDGRNLYSYAHSSKKKMTHNNKMGGLTKFTPIGLSPCVVAHFCKDDIDVRALLGQ